MTNSRLSVVSLFTGAGGLDVGLESTGRFDLLACVEVEPAFCATLQYNRDLGRFGNASTEVIEADLSTLDPHVLMDKLGVEPGSIDLLVGGPPCQAFSTAGRRQSVQDPRGELLWTFIDYVEAFRPRAFVMENVRGLLSAALRHRPLADRPTRGGPPLDPDELPGSVVELWVQDLAERCGEFCVDAFEVNAVNYGAPQLRERVLFFGNRLGAAVNFPSPTHAQDGAGGLEPFASLGDALDRVEEVEPVLLDFSPRKKSYLSLVPPGGNWRSLPDEVARESMGRAYLAKGGRSGWWRRLSRDLPCPTVVTMPNHASTSMCHPDEVRVLSVTECASVQEFPVDWEFLGTPVEQYRQVGNAVPARLGAVAGRVISDLLDEPIVQNRTASYRLTYLKSHVRTRRWYSEGKAVVRGSTAG